MIVRFFDTAGTDITEDAQRKIERLFQREDARRAMAEEMGDIQFPPRALEEYTVALEATVEPAAIREHRFKLVVDYSYGAASTVMPTLLGKLGADVLAVNPYVSTAGRVTFDHEQAAQRVAGLVRAAGAHLGAVIDADGERLRLVDDQGRVLSDTEALLAFVELVSDHLLGDTIALPVNTTQRARDIAGAHGVHVVPTKLSTPALMSAANDPAVGFAADGAGGCASRSIFTRARRAGRCSRCRPVGLFAPLAERGDRRSAEGAPGARDRRDALGAEGHGDAVVDGDGLARRRAGGWRED
ncbi:MAG: hypothetical protein H6514_09570 [Acidimicrobiaceae bacterium]|nr:hypothetical protein [Acidimicrobiaceae bacterium]